MSLFKRLCLVTVSISLASCTMGRLEYVTQMGNTKPPVKLNILGHRVLINMQLNMYLPTALNVPQKKVIRYWISNYFP